MLLNSCLRHLLFSFSIMKTYYCLFLLLFECQIKYLCFFINFLYIIECQVHIISINMYYHANIVDYVFDHKFVSKFDIVWIGIFSSILFSLYTPTFELNNLHVWKVFSISCIMRAICLHCKLLILFIHNPKIDDFGVNLYLYGILCSDLFA